MSSSFDLYEDVGTQPFPNLEVPAGPAFPITDKIGKFFIHDSHGLCVYCHDGAWRRVRARYLPPGA